MNFSLPRKRGVEVNASILKRIAAFIIDIVILEFVVVFPFESRLSAAIPKGSLKETLNFAVSNSITESVFPVIVAIAVLSILYFAVFEYKYGRTIGKMVLNLRVVSLGKNLELWQCFARALMLIPFYPLVFLDLIFVFFNQNNQRVLEMLSRTKVVGRVIL